MKMIKAVDLAYEYSKISEIDAQQKEEKVIALAGINLEIEKGEFVAILGHNGSGKSTFAKQINALIHPTHGTLWVKGYDTKNEEFIWDIRQSAGMVFQNPDNQLVATVVEEDVAFGPENLGVAPAEIHKRVETALDSVKMTEYRTHAPSKLSGGQKQRIAIAGVLAMKPDCIVLDEPTAMLDPLGRKDVIRTILKLNQEEGITIVLITHYMDEAVRADKVFVIDDGKMVMEGTPKEIFSQVKRLKEYGLDVPQVTETAFLLQKKGVSIQSDILTIEEMVDFMLQSLHKPIKEAIFKDSVSFDWLALKEEVDRQFDYAKEFQGIQIKNLSHIYGQGTAFEKKALDDVNISIRRGEFIGLIGHTGSGKSTLVQHFNALISPTAGNILLDGQDIYTDKTKLKQVRQRVGLVFQYPEHQLFEMTVFKDVSFGPKNMGLSEEKIHARVCKALETVGIGKDQYDKSPFELSGGQKRRVAIAGVIAMNPEVLILDEPTAGLDPRGRDEILATLRSMHKKMGITIILVSHSMEDVAKTVERIIVMHKGQAVLTGPPRDIFSKVSLIEQMGLAAPQISYVMQRLRSAPISIPVDIFTPEEAAEALASVLRAGVQS